jgi:hypothetical protein
MRQDDFEMNVPINTLHIIDKASLIQTTYT